MKKLYLVMRKHPVFSYGIIILLAQLFVVSLQLEYDAGWILLFILLDILGFPYYFVKELTNLNAELSAIIGLLIFLVFELIYQSLRKNFKSNLS